MSTLTLTQIQLPLYKSRARALSLALVAASRPAPLLDIPTELGLEILELSLTHTPFTTLSVVSKAFGALVSSILYRHVVLDSIEALSLFHRTVKSKSPHFLETHIKTLVVTIEPWRFAPRTRIELERVIAACTGVRALSLPRPGIFAEPLSHLRNLPSEVTIQSFDATAPFQWEHAPLRATVSTHNPASHFSVSLTHLRISEPGDTWHSPLSILAFFGSTPHLTHLSLARRRDANTDNDEVFVDEVCTLLASRPKLRMLVVSIFPAQWPCYSSDTTPAASSTIWAVLSSVAEADKRLILVAAGLECRQDVVSWANPVFWERSRMELATEEDSLYLTTTPMAPQTHDPPPRKSRPRVRARLAQGLAAPELAARRAAPLLDMPAEIGLEILELALMDTHAGTLTVVSKRFNALVSNIIYKTLVLKSLKAIALFHRTVQSMAKRSPEFLATHVRTLAVTAASYTTVARAQLNEIVAACKGVRTLAIPRPGILACPSISWIPPGPGELILEKFDAITPFEWDPLFNVAADSPAAHLNRLTHLRICEPASIWHSPLETLEFFGALPELTHLALARQLRFPAHASDSVFVAEVRELLAHRPRLRMLVVSLFPACWPKRTRTAFSICHPACLCRALGGVAHADRRLVLLAVGWDTLDEHDEFGRVDLELITHPYANHGPRRPGSVSFWENWRMSDKRAVSLATGWEPEILPDAVRWLYPEVPSQLRSKNLKISRFDLKFKLEVNFIG
ncbi:hypothetical protein FB451DRAFT_1359406 [Mycena latifolia]|nr:hypothetical protein FB451DRAFT_1359406 [Mycena latifolia]